MRKIILFALLFVSSFGFSQDTPVNRIRFEDTASMRRTLDNSKSFLDSIDMAREMESMQRNMDSFMRMQKERDAKKKKQAFLYLGLGVFFLIVLIVGLRRRIKKK